MNRMRVEVELSSLNECIMKCIKWVYEYKSDMSNKKIIILTDGLNLEK